MGMMNLGIVLRPHTDSISSGIVTICRNDFRSGITSTGVKLEVVDRMTASRILRRELQAVGGDA